MKFYIVGHDIEHLTIYSTFLTLEEALACINNQYNDAKIFESQIGGGFFVTQIPTIATTFVLNLRQNDGNGWNYFKEYVGTKEEILKDLQLDFGKVISSPDGLVKFNTKGVAYSGSIRDNRREIHPDYKNA